MAVATYQNNSTRAQDALFNLEMAEQYIRYAERRPDLAEACYAEARALLAEVDGMAVRR